MEERIGQTVYFEKLGPQNTRRTLEIAGNLVENAQMGINADTLALDSQRQCYGVGGKPSRQVSNLVGADGDLVG